ncbi:MAG: DUF2288 domain-containing protein [Pseudanabaenales cyanobacterium]|nr:DUF2288 domain-containing protein [Pseudanabaenales cyanobacterium]
MKQNLRLELAEMIEPAEWQWLFPHANRDAVVVVDPGLDLVEVGMAIATDNVTSVQRWIGEQLIAKPSAVQLGDWGRDRTKRLKTLIIQPYVLVQDSLPAALE